MIYYSSEIRWFSDKGLPLLNQFNSLPGKSSEPQIRTDRYLNRKSATIGIKIREGRMEIKLLVEAHPNSFKRHKWISEDWIKCSYEENTGMLQKLGGIESDTFSWCNISKKREQKKFKIIRNAVTPCDFGDEIDQGCIIEYTALKIHEKVPYFTLGFESFGKNHTVSHRHMSAMLAFCEAYIDPKPLNDAMYGSYAMFCKSFQ